MTSKQSKRRDKYVIQCANIMERETRDSIRTKTFDRYNYDDNEWS